MRILLDLQICQAVSSIAARQMLSLAEQLLQQGQAAGHQMLVLLNLRLGSQHAALCQHFSRFTARDNIYSLDLPEQGPAAFLAHAQVVLHREFVRQIQADCVYVPYVDVGEIGCTHGPAVISFHVPETLDASPPLPVVAHLPYQFFAPSAVDGGITARNAAWLYQHLPALDKANLVLTESSHMQAIFSASTRESREVREIGFALPAEFLQAAQNSQLQNSQLASARRIVLLPGPQQLAIATEILIAIASLEEARHWRLQMFANLDAEQIQALQQSMLALSLPADVLEICHVDDFPLEAPQLLQLWQQSRVFICYALEHSYFAAQALACQIPLVCEQSLPWATQLAGSACFGVGSQSLSQCLHALLRTPANIPANQFPLQAGQSSASQASIILDALQASAQPTLSLAAPAPTVASTFKPRLAYISPLPPQASGIADYSLELIPELARYFEIDLIVAQSELAIGWLAQRFAVRTIAWFEQHAHEFSHILYHFGNSLFHEHMFALLERHPGVVVLHDFYLGNVLHEMQKNRGAGPVYTRALYASHGISAIVANQQEGPDQACWRYPSNQLVLAQARGVIVHSHYPANLARQWYGEQFVKDWAILPLLRGIPAHLAQDLSQARQAARAKLGWQDGDVLLCSFGMITRTKNSLLCLQAWLASNLASDKRCHLIFVGENGGDDYGIAVQEAVDAASAAGSVKITGYVSHDDYANWLLAADMAVQLRTQSRGETSAAVLDCLLYGVPTILNAHGANAEIPDEVACKLLDQHSQQDLRDALENLYANAALRQQFAQRASSYMAQRHAPQQVGQQYQLALQHFASKGKQVQYQALLQNLLRAPSSSEAAATDADLAALAAALANNQLQHSAQQLFIDVSALVQTDLKTGIQRVVRSILMALMLEPPAGFRIEPVYTLGRGATYFYARRYLENLLGGIELGQLDAPIQANRGDLFLGLDLFTFGTMQNVATFSAMRERGVKVYFVVYDILPIQRPDYFPPETKDYFEPWLECIAAAGDGLLCISRAVADEVSAWHQSRNLKRIEPLKLGYFHLGADLHASLPSQGLPDNVQAIQQAITARRSFLMVGTVEPRKGYAQALAAVELLWQQGVDVNLFIVGKQGWMVDALAKRLFEHNDKTDNKRLFWLPGISDEMLEQLYQSCSALLACSEGEGFGLPLIEAAQHGLPIIARRLPVFVEVLQEHGFYFEGLAAQDLASAIQAWLALDADNQAPASSALPWLSWQQSAAQLKNVIFDNHWYREV